MTLTLYFIFALISPLLLAATDDAGVAACCRRNGVHHCAGLMQMPAGSGPAVSSGQRCPMWPRALAASRTQQFTAAAAFHGLAEFAPQDSVVTRNARFSRLARERQLALRGPPLNFTS